MDCHGRIAELPVVVDPAAYRRTARSWRAIDLL